MPPHPFFFKGCFFLQRVISHLSKEKSTQKKQSQKVINQHICTQVCQDLFGHFVKITMLGTQKKWLPAGSCCGAVQWENSPNETNTDLFQGSIFGFDSMSTLKGVAEKTKVIIRFSSNKKGDHKMCTLKTQISHAWTVFFKAQHCTHPPQRKKCHSSVIIFNDQHETSAWKIQHYQSSWTPSLNSIQLVLAVSLVSFDMWKTLQGNIFKHPSNQPTQLRTQLWGWLVQ